MNQLNGTKLRSRLPHRRVAGLGVGVVSGLFVFFAQVASGHASELAPPGALAAPVPYTLNSPALGSSEAQMRGNRIYRSVEKNGTVVFGDHPEPGAQKVDSRQFMSYSTPEALRKAAQERAYWRHEADQFRQRQFAREQERERARLQREQDLALAAAQTRLDDWYLWHRVVGLRNFPPVPNLGVAPVYRGSPGLPGQASSGFLTSGSIARR